MVNENELTLKNPPPNMADMFKVVDTQPLPNGSDFFHLQAQDFARMALEPTIRELALKIQIQLMDAYSKYSNNSERNMPIPLDWWTNQEHFNTPVLKTDIRIPKDLPKWVCDFADVSVTVIPTTDIVRFKKEVFEE